MKPIQNQQLYQKLINPVTLPPFPEAALRTLKQLQNPNCTFMEIQDCLMLDPSLVALVLKVVNSPLFPIRQEISNIAMALSFLGFKRLRSLLYTYYFRTLLEKGTQRFPHQDKFWNHCLSVGVFAQIIGIELGYHDDTECFTAGLIHDIGRFVIGIQNLILYKEILDSAAKDGLTMFEAEERKMGFTHQEVGHGIAKKWNFPQVITDAISNHHELMGFDQQAPLTKIVTVANLLAYAESEGSDSPSDITASSLLEKMGIEKLTQVGCKALHREKLSSMTSLF